MIQEVIDYESATRELLQANTGAKACYTFFHYSQSRLTAKPISIPRGIFNAAL